MTKFFIIAIVSGIISAFSQVLLKKSAEKNMNSVIKEYLNPYVISAYLITGICMVLTIVAFIGMPYKYGAVLESLVYIYIMILSRFFFKEKITKKKLLGNIIIVIGVLVFSMGK